MPLFFLLYLAVGIGFYMGLALKDRKSFSGATWSEIADGLILGIPLWPIGVVVMLFLLKEDERK